MFVYRCRAVIYTAALVHQGIIFLRVSSSHNFVALLAGDSSTFVGIYVCCYEEAQFMNAHFKILLFLYTSYVCTHLEERVLLFSVSLFRLSTTNTLTHCNLTVIRLINNMVHCWYRGHITEDGMRALRSTHERVRKKCICLLSVNRHGDGKIFSVHAMTAYRGSGGNAPLVLKLCASWR